MKDDIRNTILDIVKGSVLLVVAGSVFYCVYPKYTFAYIKKDCVIQNQVTGEIEPLDLEEQKRLKALKEEKRRMK